MSNSDIKRFLPSERALLERTPGVSWIPEEPAELILPYIEKEAPGQKTDLDKRIEKTKRILQGYEDIEKRCKQMEDEIAGRCKDVKIKLDRSKHLRAIEACERAFGRTGIEEITFDMYKAVVHVMAARSDAFSQE